MPIQVTESQYLAIVNAASALSPGDRDEFLATVARELEGKVVGDGTLGRAVAAAFKVFFDPPQEATRPGRWDRDHPRFDKAPGC
jgi:hypothetical protein